MLGLDSVAGWGRILVESVMLGTGKLGQVLAAHGDLGQAPLEFRLVTATVPAREADSTDRKCT